jgi:hypothetical protein
MTESWRTVGGTQNYQQLNNINTNNLYTNTLTVREAYLGLFTIDGFLKVTDDVTFSKSLYIYKYLFVYGNAYLSDHLYLGSNNYTNYLYGTDTGIGVNTADPTTLFDIYGDTETVFKARNSLTTIENYPAITREFNGVSLGATASSSYINFYENNEATIGDPNTTLISTLGNLYVEPAKSTIIKSRMIISNKNPDPQHLSIENLTIYDTPNVLFRYDLYGNLFGQTGTSLTNIAGGQRTTTFITLNSYTKQGFGIGGGVITDKDLSVGTFGTYNINGVYTVAQTTISSASAAIGNNIVKKVAIGFNNVSPQIGSYILDINGPVQIRFAEINNQLLADYAFKNVAFCDTNRNYAIAVGSPVQIDPSFIQYIQYSTDEGITWTKSRVKSSAADDLEDSINYFYAANYQSADYLVIAGNNNYMYYSTDYGASWTKYTYLYDYLDFTEETRVMTITTQSIYVNNNVVFGTYTNLENSYTGQRGFYAYIPDPSGGTNVDYGYSARYKINTLGDSDLVFSSATGYGDYLYFLASSDTSGCSYLFKAQFDYDAVNFVEDASSSTPAYTYVTFSDSTLMNHYISSYGEYLVGNRIYYKDDSDTWVESNYTPAGTLNDIEVVDDNNAIAVGSQGTIIYTKDGGVNWTQMDSIALNAYGNANVLIDSTLNLLSVHRYDENTFIISYASTEYVYNETAGESKIYHVYVPTVFNRANTSVLDVCGTVHITGDLHINDGGTTYLDGELYVNQHAKVSKYIEVTGEETNKDYYVSIGSIENPSTQISQGTLALQGQNGMENYNTWKFKVGATDATTSSYDTTRLRIVDETNAGQERMTIDTYGQVGVGTKTPASLFDVSGIATISSELDTTGARTGALQVYGGASFVKNVYVGGILTMLKDDDSVSSSTGSIVISGGLGVKKSAYIGGNLVLEKDIPSVSPYTGTFRIAAGGAGIAGSLFTGGNVTIEDNTAATAPTSAAALRIPYGGAAISGSIFVGGNVTIEDTAAPTAATSAAALRIPAGGAAIAGSIFVGGNITIEDTTTATSTTAAALIVAGGVGIQDNLYVENTANATTFSATSSIQIEDTATNTDYYISVGSIADPATQISQGTVLVQGQNGMNNYGIWKFQVGSTTPLASSYDTARLRIVDEATGATERATIDQYGYVGIATAAPEAELDVSGAVIIRAASNTALYLPAGGAQIAGQITAESAIVINDATEATASTSTAALQLTAGGAAIAGSLFTGGNITIEDTTERALYIPSGSAYIGGSIYLGQNIIMENTADDSFQVAGGATITSALFTGGNITIYDTTAPTAATSAAALRIPAGGAAIAGSIFVGGNITIENTTTASSTTAAALIVAGGVGIQDNLYVENTATATTFAATSSIQIEDTASNTDYYISVGSIADPATQISQGTVLLQGQNGLNNYGMWKFQVGSTTPLASSYDTARLRIVDEATGATERATIDQYGYVGIATAAPEAELDVSGAAIIRSSSNTALYLPAGGAQIAGQITAESPIVINDTTDYSIVSAGGAVIAGSIYTGGNITIEDSTERALYIPSGSAYIGGSIYLGQNIIMENTADDSFQIAGGATISSALFTGGNITIYDTTAPTAPTSAAALRIPAGGAAIAGSLFIGGNITIEDTTTATSTTAAALIVAGGVGIQDNLYVENTANATTFAATSSIQIEDTASNTDYYISVGSIADPASQISQGTVLLQGQNGLNNYGMWKFQVGSTTPLTSSYDTARLRIVDEATGATERATIDQYGYVGIATAAPEAELDVSGAVIIRAASNSALYLPQGGAQIAGQITAESPIVINDATAPTSSTSTAALQLTAGGAAIAGSIYTGGNITIEDTTERALYIPSGSAYIGGSIYLGQNIIMENTADDSFQIAGGATITSALFTGGNITIYDTTAPTAATSAAALRIPAGGAAIAGSIFVGGNVTIENTTTATSSSAAALIVAGGVGIQDNLYVENTATATTFAATSGIQIEDTASNTDYYISVGSIADPASQISQGTVLVQGQNGLNNYGMWKFQVGSTTPLASSYDTARLRIVDEATGATERMTIDQYGYVGIATTTPEAQLDVSGDTILRGTTTIYSLSAQSLEASSLQATSITIENTSTSALYITGGAQIAGAIYTGGNITIADTTAATSSTGAAALMVAGGVAIAGSIYTGGNINIENTGTSALYIAGGAQIAGSFYTGGNITIADTTAATSSTAAALMVAGGAGIQGDLYVDGVSTLEEIETTAIYVTGTSTATEYSATIGSISDPTSTMSRGALILQGQNAMDNYSVWNISVGAIESGTSSYDTARLRISDTAQNEERLTIDMYGYVGIGTTTPQAALDINGSIIVENNATIYGNIITYDGTYISTAALSYISNLTSDAQSQIDDISSNTTAITYSDGTTTAAGDFTATGTITAANYETTSDYRIKENIDDLPEQINTKQLRPVEYFNSKLNKYDIGLIAHEVADIYPFMVSGEKDGEEYQSVNYRHIIMALMNDVRELRREVAELSAAAAAALT